MLRNGCFGGFSPIRPPAAVVFAHIPGSGSPLLGNLPALGERKSASRFSELVPGRVGLQPRAEKHHVQRARGQQHEHQRDLQAVAGEFENRPHDERMMERVRARVSDDIFGSRCQRFRTRLRVDSLNPKREKVPEGAQAFVTSTFGVFVPHQGKLVRNSSACVCFMYPPNGGFHGQRILDE